MSFVVDTSILVAWFLNEKADPRVEAAFNAITRVQTRAPDLLYYELRNALLVSERRSRCERETGNHRNDRGEGHCCDKGQHKVSTDAVRSARQCLGQEGRREGAVGW